MSKKVADVWICNSCNNIRGRHDEWFEGDICGDCSKRHEPKDRVIHEHIFRIIPKSGTKKGIPLWKCITCNKVVQSS